MTDPASPGTYAEAAEAFYEPCGALDFDITVTLALREALASHCMPAEVPVLLALLECPSEQVQARCRPLELRHTATGSPWELALLKQGIDVVLVVSDPRNPGPVREVVRKVYSDAVLFPDWAAARRALATAQARRREARAPGCTPPPPADAAPPPHPPPGLPEWRGVIELGGNRDPVGDLATMKLLTRRATRPDAPRRLEELRLEVEQAEAALRERCIVFAANPGLPGEPPEEGRRERDRVELGLGLVGFAQDLLDTAGAVPTAAEHIRDAGERLVALLEAVLAGIDLGLVADWHRACAAGLRAACQVAGLTSPSLQGVFEEGGERARDVCGGPLPLGPMPLPPWAGLAGRPERHPVTEAALERARKAGCTVVAFEFSLPRAWMRGPARPFPAEEGITWSDEISCSILGLPGLPTLSVVPARTPGGGERLACAVAWTERSAQGAAERRLRVLRPARRIVPLLPVWEEVVLPGNPQWQVATADGGGTLLLALSDREGVELARVAGGQLERLAWLPSARSARFLPAADPVLCWRQRTAADAPWEAWSLRASEPTRLTRWADATAMPLGIEPDGTLRLVEVYEGELRLNDLAPGGQTPRVVLRGPAPGQGWELDRCARAAGRDFLLWRWQQPRGGGDAETHADGAIAATVIEKGRVGAPVVVWSPDCWTPWRHEHIGASLAGAAAGPNLCLVTRSSTSSFDADYEHETRTSRLEIRVFDASLRPVTGPRSLRLLDERAGSLRQDVVLVPRGDGSMSLVAAAGLGPSGGGRQRA